MRKPNETLRKKRSFAFCLLYYWTKLTCINPLTLSDDNELRFSYYSLFFSILLTVSYAYICYSAFIERLEMLLPGETPIGIIGITMNFVSEFFEAVQTWIMFGFHQNRVKLIVKSFTKAEETSLKLDIRFDNEKSFRKLAVKLIVTTSTYVFVWAVIAYGSLIVEHRFNNLTWTCYIFPQIMIFNRWAIFIWSLEIVREKFQRLNDKVRSVGQNEYGQMTDDNTMASRSMKYSNCNSIAEKIQLIAQLHGELRMSVYRIVQHIAVCVLFDILAQFLNMTICTHIAYRFLKGRGRITFDDFMYLGAISFWIFIPICLMGLISNASGSAADEANKTGHILHAIINDIDNFHGTQESAKFSVLSLDLLQNQLRISVFGFFDFGHYFVFKFLTTATTYLTIMLQFYN